MLYLNEYDLQHARQRFIRSTVPNRLALVMTVDALREETDMVSDGWAYWPKPCRAARRAMELVQSTTWAANAEQEREDITDAEMRAAVRPIRSFLTRHASVYSTEARERILRAVDAEVTA